MNSENPDTSAPSTRITTVGMVSYGSSLVVLLCGEFDLANRQSLTEAMDTVVERSEQRVYLDASQLRFCDAAGFGLLAETAVRLKRADRQVILLHCSPILNRLQSLIFSSEELADITIRRTPPAPAQRQQGP